MSEKFSVFDKLKAKVVHALNEAVQVGGNVSRSFATRERANSRADAYQNVIDWIAEIQGESQEKFNHVLDDLATLATRKHYWCDDSYYSCPATEEGCSNPAYEDTKECQCGADEHNAKVAALIRSIRLGT